MTRTDIQSAVSAELHRIAPEIAIDDIDRRADLREEFDMPEADYSRMRSFDALIDYIESKAH